MQQLEHVRFPEEAGISSQGILNYIAAREAAGLEHHAIWVMRHGKVAAKLNYAPYDDHTPHMLFSLSKSFCSAAAGFAVQEGLLHWDTKLIDVLPEAFPEDASDWLKAITMHHLLTMGSGLKPESDGGRAEPGWAKTILSYGCDHEPGTHFAYNSMSTYLVSCMVQRVTGMTIRDYLIPRLFEPLGMMNEDGSAPKWDSSPDGINVGGGKTWSHAIQDAAKITITDWFPKNAVSSRTHFGIVLAIICVIVIYYIINRTTLGYRLKAVGYNRSAAEYAGINANRCVIVSLAISGALASLAGGLQVMGVTYKVTQFAAQESYGFNGITVALIGATNPIGTLIAGWFFGAMKYAGTRMKLLDGTRVPKEIVDIIMGCIVFFIAISNLFRAFVMNHGKKGGKA